MKYLPPRTKCTAELWFKNTICWWCLGVALLTGGCNPSQKSGANPSTKMLSTSSTASRLDIIKKRGKLICGVNDQLPGFSFKEADGEYSGISVDFCRAIAAAIFNNPKKVEFRHLSSEERFKAVAQGQVDILSRNTTWTLRRDTAEGLDFPPTNFYDGQGILVRSDSGINTLEDLNGKAICVPTRTTTEVNLAEQMRKNNVGYRPVTFEENTELFTAYEARNCDAATSDRSELVARKTEFADPEAHQILQLVLSKEPLGPVIANGEPDWFDVVKWVFYAAIKAEELQITSENVDHWENTKSPQIRRFLGLEGNLGASLELPPDFAKRVVQYLGNYSEIYERNIGSPFGLPRGDNALWKDGGLLYSPPFR